MGIATRLGETATWLLPHLPQYLKKTTTCKNSFGGKNNMNVHILNDHMDPDIAAIWIKIGTTKKTSVIIGG